MRILLAATLLLSSIPASAYAAPETSSVAPSGEQSVDVLVTQPSPSIAPDGRLQLAVDVNISAPAEYVEVRVRMRSPSGRLVYQKTEVRSDLTAGTHAVSYDYDLTSLDLAQGRYPIEVRVLATGADPTIVSSRLLIVDDDTSAIPVAVVVAPTDVPSVTMAGRFTRDPAEDTGLRDDLAFLTQLALDRDVPLALALPPVLTEQLARAAAGYETTAGVTVAATAEQPVRYAHMLESLRSAVSTGTIDLIDVPYALPELEGLASIGGGGDLGLHWTQTDAVNAAALHSEPESPVAYLGEHLTTDALSTLDERGVSCVLAHGTALRSGDATAAAGCYTVGASGVKVLVVDDAAASGAHLGSDAFYDALFDRLDDGPVVILLRTGPGAPNDTIDAQHALDWIAAASWLRVSDIASLPRGNDTETAVLARPGERDSLASYWADVATSRSAVIAFSGATGAQDMDAAAALRALLVAESSLVACDSESDGARTEGLARASEALDFVSSQFALIRLDAKDITLSGSKGDVPLTLINDTGRQLTFTLTATSSSMRSTAGSQDIVVQPAQNFLTLPVDLGNALADDLLVTVRAGDVTVAEATVNVKASYIDRLATILMVVVVLGVLLVIIRRRVTRADAGTIVEDPRRSLRASRDE